MSSTAEQVVTETKTFIESQSFQKARESISKASHHQSSKKTIKAIFNDKEVILDFEEQRLYNAFLDDSEIENGKILGSGGSKKVFNVSGEAVFLICGNSDFVEKIFNDEIGLSNKLASLGLMAQSLKKSLVKIYIEEDNLYYDYPCMVADSFSTLSAKHGFEVFDSKNTIRFGKKFRLYPEDNLINDIAWNCKAFTQILEDLAILLYHNVDIDYQDSINIAFMQAKDASLPAQARLFLYDFSSKTKIVNHDNKPLLKMPYSIARYIKKIVEMALEAEYMAKTSSRCDYRPDFVDDFMKGVYPTLEEDFIAIVSKSIAEQLAKAALLNIQIPALLHAYPQTTQNPNSSTSVSLTTERNNKCSI